MNHPIATSKISLKASVNAIVPTRFDILNGRGQGVHRHPGNAKYRSLVQLNKGLYAKCPRSNKIKISKGIVAAVRELGGRFLELDNQSGTYHDIGDKKAYEKTSQALREGQTKVRQKIYRENGSLPLSTPKSASGHQQSYFEYSVDLLESLYKSDEDVAFQPPSRHEVSRSPSPVSEASGFTASTFETFQPSLYSHRISRSPSPISDASDDASTFETFQPSLHSNEISRSPSTVSISQASDDDVSTFVAFEPSLHRHEISRSPSPISETFCYEGITIVEV
eukprot:CAMPEP_0183726400 /NCGR_PEP_ID=MMETSP0737-20130205/23102_1 /TAXON_ID=385413 /ORGANISM="Thalassiosira miniscula, Strain CCMP1093" /LENGTH=279 /DNA_ID=CAMNT_0025957725 /DNA_START=39 /DNA_END=878 /DNA_ORIENTATION=-